MPATEPMSDTDSRRDEEQVLWVGLAVAGVVALAYWTIAILHRPTAGVAVGLRDAYLFHQYAAAISAGHPYVFSPGDAPSTGSTSHLYPWLLSIFHFLGARGGALSAIGALLSTAALGTSVACIWAIGRRLAPRVLWLALLLNALSGQLAITLFAQTDATLFVPLALAAFTAWLYGRTGWLSAALVALSLTRPEGVLISLALFAAHAISPGEGDDRPADPRRPAAYGVAAFCATLLLNLAIGGSWLPHSVAGKGLLHEFGAIGALFHAARAGTDIFVELVLGLGESTRRYYLLPGIGGALALLGLFARIDRGGRGSAFDRAFTMAALAAIAAAILGGVSGIHLDRYFAWLLPIWLVYVALGVQTLIDRVPRLPLAGPLAVLLVVFQAAGAFYMLGLFANSSAINASNVRFALRLDEGLPEQTRLGMAGASGLAYFLPRHHVTNVNGSVSPAFAHSHANLVGAEILEHRPELRFDYWLLTPQRLRFAWYRDFVGEAVTAEPDDVSGGDALTLYRARWDSLDGIAEPLDATVLEKVSDLALSTTVDVGWPESEAAHAYQNRSERRGARHRPLLVSGEIAGRRVSEAGRVVAGVERFRITGGKGVPAVLVLRTAAAGTVQVRNALATRPQRLTFPSPLELEVRVEGRAPQLVQLEIAEDAGRIQEFAIPIVTDLPESSLASPRVEVWGHYLSLGWWVYSKPATPTVEIEAP